MSELRSPAKAIIGILVLIAIGIAMSPKASTTTTPEQTVPAKMLQPPTEEERAKAAAFLKGAAYARSKLGLANAEAENQKPTPFDLFWANYQQQQARQSATASTSHSCRTEHDEWPERQRSTWTTTCK